MKNLSIIQQQFNLLRNLLQYNTTDISWSRYSNIDEILLELATLENDIINMKPYAAEQLCFLLAPTGSLQEISISNGWGVEFCNIADSMENAISN